MLPSSTPRQMVKTQPLAGRTNPPTPMVANENPPGDTDQPTDEGGGGDSAQMAEIVASLSDEQKAVLLQMLTEDAQGSSTDTGEMTE